jgi:hypothetical protein
MSLHDVGRGADLAGANLDATQLPESAFDAAPDGQDGKAEQEGTEEPHCDLE